MSLAIPLYQIDPAIQKRWQHQDHALDGIRDSHDRHVYKAMCDRSGVCSAETSVSLKQWTHHRHATTRPTRVRPSPSLRPRGQRGAHHGGPGPSPKPCGDKGHNQHGGHDQHYGDYQHGGNNYGKGREQYGGGREYGHDRGQF